MHPTGKRVFHLLNLLDRRRICLGEEAESPSTAGERRRLVVAAQIDAVDAVFTGFVPMPEQQFNCSWQSHSPAMITDIAAKLVNDPARFHADAHARDNCDEVNLLTGLRQPPSLPGKEFSNITHAAASISRSRST